MKTKSKKLSPMPVILHYNKSNALFSGFMFLQNNSLASELKYKSVQNGNQNALFSSFSNLMIAEIMDE